MPDTDDIYKSHLRIQEEKLKRCEALLPYTDCNKMSDSSDNFFRQSLSPDQVVILLQETRNDIAEIKKILTPLHEWKSKMQGGMFIIGFALTMIVGSGGFLTWRWWDQSIQTALLQSDINHIQGDLTVINNQLSIARSNSESNSQVVQSLSNKTKDYDPQLSDLKSRISSLETGAITKHIGK
jgi:hypothetical protein